MTRPRGGRSTAGAVVLLLLALAWWWFAPGGGPDADRAPSAGVSAAPAEPSSEPTRTSSEPSTRPSLTARPAPPRGNLPDVSADRLPVEAVRTLRLIAAGGPFPYPDRDGAVFGNLERRLPQRARGYYREYTVPTPGSDDRGARRIVTGAEGERYWTSDHYASFARIVGGTSR